MNIISQKLKEMLNIKIKNEISNKILSAVDDFTDFIFDNTVKNKYFHLISSLESATKEIIKNVIITTIEELDLAFKNSPDRLSTYIINKSNVPRTLVTIFGTITFNRTYYINKISNSKVFYIDQLFNIPKYDHFDTVVKAIAIDKSFNISQAESSRITSNIVGGISSFCNDSLPSEISRQSIYNWIKSWNVPNIIPKAANTPDTIYVMADEKFIGSQDLNKDIMVKTFVVFEGVKTVSKGRRSLINKRVFSCFKSSAWPCFMDFLSSVYDFSKIKHINLLADGGKWIKSGIYELKLFPINTVTYRLCSFHFIQAIHRMTSDKTERSTIREAFNTLSKKDFITYIEYFADNNPHKKDKIIKNLTYIINNYKAIKDMLLSDIGSSMESHISHLIASMFSSRPKGYSSKNIDKYLQLNDFKYNGINIFNLYLQTFKNTKVITINENDYSLLTSYGKYTCNMPILATGNSSDSTYHMIHNLCHS